MTQRRNVIALACLAALAALAVFFVSSRQGSQRDIAFANQAPGESPSSVDPRAHADGRGKGLHDQSLAPAKNQPSDKPSGDFSALPPGMEAIEQYETRDQWQERLRREKLAQLYERLEAVFGTRPENPLAELGRLSESELSDLLQCQHDEDYPAAQEIGWLTGEAIPPQEWLTWFEHSGAASGSAGSVGATILHWALSGQSGKFRYDTELARRALAVIDGYLQEWQGKAISADALGSIWSAFESLCPIEGGVELIRRWTIDTPHGHEEVETRLVACLRQWPLSEVSPTVREVLATLRGGAIKGLVSSWSASRGKTGDSAWTKTDALDVLSLPVADAVCRTSSSAAVLYARAIGGSDLLAGQSRKIAHSLLERSDSVYCTAQGFAYLAQVDGNAAQATWAEWFDSGDEYRVHAAYLAAPSMPKSSVTEVRLQKLHECAMNFQLGASRRGAAALALCQHEGGSARMVAVLDAFLTQAAMDDPMLIAAGRIVLWLPREQAEEALRRAIQSPDSLSGHRCQAMFLLAAIAPLKALSMAENALSGADRFDDLTMLLVAAVAEAMEADQAGQRARVLRAKCSLPEPGWIREIRLRQTGPNDRAEHKVVSFARARP